MAPSLSALIIAKDEERDLPGCLESLRGVVDEAVVLVDAATADKTEEVARRAGARTARRVFDDYAAQRQAALELCVKDWVLWIDADERLDEGLRRDLPALLGQPGVDAWSLPFRVRFLGRDLRFGGLGGERHVRLFKREKARFSGGYVHEGAAVEGRVERYRGPGRVLHQPYHDIADYMGKLERYTDLAAQKRFAAGRRFRPWHYLIGPWEFGVRAFVKLGVLDGGPGLTWARLAAWHSWLKYAKLKRLERPG